MQAGRIIDPLRIFWKTFDLKARSVFLLPAFLATLGGQTSLAQAPAISMQPQSQVAIVGPSVTLNVTASGGQSATNLVTENCAGKPVFGLKTKGFTQSDVSSILRSGELINTAKVNSLGVTAPNSNAMPWRRRVRTADPLQPIQADFTPLTCKNQRKSYAK